MSKIRTYEDFLDSIQEEKAWRVKEILTLSVNVSESKGILKDILIRASIALVYAHWEGFIKNASQNYLNYLSYALKGKLNDPKDANCHIFALSLWGAYRNKGGLDGRPSPKKYIETIKECFNNPDNELKIPSSKIIQTESNLNYRVLCDICSLIDIDSSEFKLKQKLIDENLLKFRNEIVHGEKVYPSETEYCIIKDQILEMITTFYNLLANNIVQKKYLAS